MKNLAMMMVLGMAMVLGCSSDKVREFMPGTYVNAAGGEFSVASDTLVVELVEGNNYVVHRRTGYNLLRDGKLGKRAYETEEWQAIYSADNGTLTETRKGKLITFFPEKKVLLVGRREYQKMR